MFTVGQDADTKQNIAHQVMVTTGPGTGETVSIAKGLNGGETVITEGGDRLRDGARVQLPSERPASGAAGAAGARRGASAAAAGASGGQRQRRQRPDGG